MANDPLPTPFRSLHPMLQLERLVRYSHPYAQWLIKTKPEWTTRFVYGRIGMVVTPVEDSSEWFEVVWYERDGHDFGDTEFLHLSQLEVLT
jgi:hypothetical protein